MRATAHGAIAHAPGDFEIRHISLTRLARALIAGLQGGLVLKVMLYGRLGEQLGSEVELDLPGGTDTVARLRTVLAQRFPGSSDEFLELTSVCIADTIVADDHLLGGAQAVEFFPPLSGG